MGRSDKLISLREASIFIACAAVFSGVINILGFTAPLFMLEVYDRVVPSGNLPTLVALLVLAAGLYGFAGFLDVIRSRILSRLSGIADTTLSIHVARAISLASLKANIAGDTLKPAQEADQIRGFLGGPGPVALFDLPWLPIYLVVCFFLHPMIGWLATTALLVLVSLTIATDFFTRSRTKEAASATVVRNRLGEAANRNAEAIAAMGFLPEVIDRWIEGHSRVTRLQRRAGDVSCLFSGVSKTIRQVVQSASLALGAWLVIRGELTGGSIIAASVIVQRALQPIEQVIANWRSMIGAYQAWQGLQTVFCLFADEKDRTSLPAPSDSLRVEGLFVAPAGERERMTVQNVSFRAEAGSAIGIIGPSASGKSSLVRAIAGVWPPRRGRICLDGALLGQWPTHELGRHIGYMPQSSDLFPGTIAENIARLDRSAEAVDIIAAAQAAGTHGMIVALPDGYQTQITNGGTNLSAGQRQRVALARALYGKPFLVILDEPNANLDVEGDRALAEAIAGVKSRGGIVIVVAHRSSVLSQLDMLLVMDNGIAKAFGPRDVVLKSLQQPNAAMSRMPRTTHSPTLAVIEGEGAQP